MVTNPVSLGRVRMKPLFQKLHSVTQQVTLTQMYGKHSLEIGKNKINLHYFPDLCAIRGVLVI